MADRSNHCRVLAIVIVAIHVVLLNWSSVSHFPTIDEVGHFPAGVSHWWYGNYRLYHVNPPLVRMVATLPVVLPGPPEMSSRQSSSDVLARPEFAIGCGFLNDSGFEALWYFSLARIATLPFSLLGAYASYALAHKFYGAPAALVALSLWCFCPTVLAYGACITPDVGAAACGLLAWVLFLKWMRSSTISSMLLFGAGLGVAQLTKTTWLVLFALCPAIFVLNWFFYSRSNIRALSKGTAHLAIVSVIAVCIMNLGYGFDRSMTPLGKFEFMSKPLADTSTETSSNRLTGNRFSESWLGASPVPLPANYVLGIDFVKWEFERGYASYLRGEWRHGGWWYYYLYAMGMKLPVGTMLLAACAVGILAYKTWRSPMDAWNDVMILAPAVAILALVSSQTGFNHHIRYVLPALPLIYVWASQLAAYVRRDRPLRSGAILTALTWAITSSLWIYPHSMSYFNELAGGPLNGNQHLHNSNVDWGQDLTYLKNWMDDHPDVKEVGVAAYHWVKLEQMGLPTYEANHWPSDPNHDTQKTTGPLPGWFAISQNHLVGEPHKSFFGRPSEAYDADPSRSYFKRFKPVGSIGYSMLLYHVSVDEANALRKEFGLSPLDDPEKPAK
jgi:hypothetical protein